MWVTRKCTTRHNNLNRHYHFPKNLHLESRIPSQPVCTSSHLTTFLSLATSLTLTQTLNPSPCLTQSRLAGFSYFAVSSPINLGTSSFASELLHVKVFSGTLRPLPVQRSGDTSYSDVSSLTCRPKIKRCLKDIFLQPSFLSCYLFAICTEAPSSSAAHFSRLPGSHSLCHLSQSPQKPARIGQRHQPHPYWLFHWLFWS